MIYGFGIFRLLDVYVPESFDSWNLNLKITGLSGMMISCSC